MSAPLSPASHVDAAWTVNDVLRHHPVTVRVFNSFGVDACCGGAQSLADAAREAGIEAGALLTAIDMVIAAEEGAGT